jgi:hypothetical protein
MPHLLEGCYAKIQRSIESVHNLNTEITNYLWANPKPYRTVGDHENNATEYVIKGFADPVPLRFAVLAGEIIHNIRSSLDHLITALILSAGETPTTDNSFPICDTADKYETACNDGRIKGVARPARKVLRSVQPYLSTDPANHPLVILRSLSNIDKHSLLIIAAATTYLQKTIKVLPVPGVPSPEGDGMVHLMLTSEQFERQGVPLLMTEDGNELLRFRFMKPAPDVQVEGEFTPQIAFAEFGGVKFKPLIPGLAQLHDAVVLILGQFEPLF